MKKRTFKYFIAPLILLLSLGLYGQDQEYFAEIENPETIEASELAKMDTNFSTFASLLELSGLETQLKDHEEFTFLIPTDDAFEEMERGEFNELKDPQNKGKLQEFIRRHIIPQKISLLDFDNNNIIETSDGDMIEVDANQDLQLVHIGGAQIIASDIETSDGIIHVVDAVVRETDDIGN